MLMRRMKSKADRSRTVATSLSSSDDDISLGTCAVNRYCLFQRYFTAHRRGAFAAESIFPQVQGIMEGGPFNVSLLRF
jgi:hypothetical protein